MSIAHDFPSYRLRHRLRVWRDRRRHPWYRAEGVAQATAMDDVDTATDDADTATDGREGRGLGPPLEVDLTDGTFQPWNSRSRVRRYWGSRPHIPHPRALILLFMCGIAFLVTLSVVMTLRAAADLKRGRSALVQARNEVAKGDFAQAAVTFETARNAFDSAKVSMDNPFVSGAASIPLIGRTPDAIRAASEAGLLVTDAGQGLSSAVVNLRGGVEAWALDVDSTMKRY